MIVAVVVVAACAAAARETVRAALEIMPGVPCEVLDLDGHYQPVGTERVRTADGLRPRLDVIRLTHDEGAVLPSLTALWSAHLLDGGEAVLGIVPGVILESAPSWSEDPRITVAVARATEPTGHDGTDISLLATEMFVLGTGANEHRAALERIVADWRSASRWLDLFVARVPHRVIVDDAVLVSSANSGSETVLCVEDRRLVRDGTPVVALDLVGLDPDRPWVFDGRTRRSSGPLLSRNPSLATMVKDLAARERSVPAALPQRCDAAVIRDIARSAAESGERLDSAITDLDSWLLELVPSGDRTPVVRYLAGVRRSRPDLTQAFPNVPGRDIARLARWATQHGVHEPRYDPALLRRAADVTLTAQPTPEKGGRRPPGVNLIGYLSGALGIGTSARLLDAALEQTGVATSTFAVSVALQSRTSSQYRRTEGVRFDTSLLAVNADQAKAVAESLPDVVNGTYRIGMWYWEVETFPRSRDGAFAYVDEVWVATDFIRNAIAQHAPVPVRTVMPPLPQRGKGDPPAVPAGLQIPADRPWFFFAFDYLSTAERKNPLGLIEAFTRAFPVIEEDGPLLVIKTLNADRRVGDAERVRLAAAGRPDVLLVDQYLEPDDLTALMARCTAYVSLHRAEGLGLTVAEAMAWGRPVVVSAYSGTMQFTNTSNAYLVPCATTAIPLGAEPYPAGTPWGDPDLDQAASILRQIIRDPEVASAIGNRAAEDIRVLHSPEAAAVGVREALDAAWRRQRELRARSRIFWFRPLVQRLRRGQRLP